MVELQKVLGDAASCRSRLCEYCVLKKTRCVNVFNLIIIKIIKVKDIFYIGHLRLIAWTTNLYT